ncbi:prohead protease/major capsid protein fusion protein [Sphingobium sp. RAC03]|uniref:prohead protease/major capsid protein fusion protein n=1 Tax=Sphingobium sp. RAC03 TaxID=1843368 RepID=UPI00083DB985|nr:prohead protease/major capsid protein fusion protein [Sphingobium sp. RAC03]AOF96513.1 mu-like prophage major head subunit gpT family protein [Sphingobium sp. RAC03]
MTTATVLPPEQQKIAPTMVRAASVRPASYRESDHSVEICWTTGAAGLRFDWYDGEYYFEELSLEPSAVRLGRLNAGACLLDSHQDYSLRSVLGSVVPDSVSIGNGEGVARVSLARTPDVADTNQKIIDGHIRSVSVGYLVHSYLRTEEEGKRPHLLAVDWEPIELSMVAVPFDAGAQVRARSAEQGGHPCIIRGAAAASQENIMPDPVIVPAADPAPPVPPVVAPAVTPVSEQRQLAPAITAKMIRERCARSADLGSDFALELIEENEETPLTEAAFERKLSDRLIDKRQSPHIDVRVGPTGTESEGYRRAIETAVILQANPSVKVDQGDADAAREFRGMSLMELARDYVQRTGISASGMGKLELAGAALGLRYGAMTTSDFANALSNAASKRVRAAYEAAPQTFGPIVSKGTLPDFKETSIIGLGDAPSLLLVRENAEFTYGAVSDTGMTYKLQTYGRIIAITRQALINDDKSLFGRLPTMFGRKAADLESDLVYATLLSNPVMADGFNLFSAQHGNLAGTGGAITVATVGAAEQAMLQQTSVEGGFLTIRPEYLIVGPAKKVEAQQFLTSVAAVQTSNVNPYPGTLQLIVEPRITGNQWFLSASPTAFDTLELAHLDGQEALYTETQAGFDVDGVKTKARLDVGAAVIDHRGLYRNPGN